MCLSLVYRETNNTHLLTGLQSGVAYIISIVAVIHIPSPVVGPVTASV